jgi:hypothetical protein
LDPGAKISSRLHHARCGAATQSKRGEPPLRWIVLAKMWTRPSDGTTIVDGSIVCLENRQRIAACEQIFSNDRSAGAGHRPRLSGINGLSGWHASCFGQWQRSIVPAIASGWRATHCKVHAMIASRSRPGVRAPSHHKTSYQRRLGRIAHKHLHTIGSLARAEFHCGFAPFPMQQPSQRRE